MPSAFCQMPLSSGAPDAIVGASAILIPSGRTYGSDIAKKSKPERMAAGVVEVESSAWKVPGSEAADASVAHKVSAPATPEVLSSVPLETNAIRPGVLVTVRGVTWEVSKQ